VSDFWVMQQAGIVLFVSVLLIIALSNQQTLRRINDYRLPTRLPRVSVLVPARNEEANIGHCVSSLLAQDYPDIEIIVLDDDSSDGTGQILAALAQNDLRLRTIRGESLPDGWLGKPWACYQLWQASDGELLLFTDADTRHAPQSVRDAVAALSAEGADLLCAIPHQDVGSWAEKLLVPLIPWSIFSFVPLVLMHRRGLRVPSAAVGQFMLFRRQAYEDIGGHAAVREHAAEDLALGRRVKSASLSLRLTDGGQRICVRMYRNSREAYEGFSKNLFAAFDYRMPAFVFVWLWLGFVFLEPLAVLTLPLFSVSLHPISTVLAAVAVIASLLLWEMMSWRFRFPRYLGVFYPAIILSAVVVALRSMVLTLSGRATWKGRTLPKARER
jgi:chlorobactene glucosyltransferase